MVYCNKIEQSNAGCNEIELNKNENEKTKKKWRQTLKYDTRYQRNSY